MYQEEYGENLFKDFSSFKKIEKKAFNINKKVKPSVAFVTPYPNDKSGCADYSYATIKELSKYVNVDVFTDAENISKSKSVRAFKKIHCFEYLMKDYDEVISVIGNSHFHLKIFDNVINYGGSVIEHDNRLLDFINYKYGLQKTSEIASVELNRDVSESEIESWIQGKKHFETLFFNDLYDSSSNFFLHSKKLVENFEKINKGKATYLPFCQFIENNIKNYNLIEKAGIKMGIPLNEVVITTFGGVAASKLYEECVQSLKYLKKPQGKNFKLYFIGECNVGEYIRINEISSTNKTEVFVKQSYYFTREILKKLSSNI